MPPGPLRVGLVVEDHSFGEFLLAAARRLADLGGRRCDILDPKKVHGCRAKTLVALCDRVEPSCDLLLVGVDAAGPSHVRRSRTHRQKERSLRPLLERFDAKLLLAVAAPSIEAWPIADPNGFSRGLENAIGRAFTMPPK